MAHFFAVSLDMLPLRVPNLHAQDKYTPYRLYFLSESSIDPALVCTGAYSDRLLPAAPYGMQ